MMSFQLQAHRERNSVLAQELLERGVSLDAETTIDVHFWSENQENASALAHVLYDRGARVMMLRPTDCEHADKWVIEEAISEAFTTDLIGVAKRCSSEYEGWGTSL